MRRLFLIVGGLLAAGCAAESPPHATPLNPSITQFVTSGAPTENTASTATSPTDATASAVTLSFNPAVMPDYPLPGLDRDAHQRSAFFGYVDSTTEFYFISTYDDQGDGCYPWNDSYDRLAVTARAGAVTR